MVCLFVWSGNNNIKKFSRGARSVLIQHAFVVLRGFALELQATSITPGLLVTQVKSDFRLCRVSVRNMCYVNVSRVLEQLHGRVVCNQQVQVSRVRAIRLF